MKVLVTVATCDEAQCRTQARPPFDGWEELAGRDVCPSCLARRRAAADAAMALLHGPLPRSKPDVPARGAQRRIQALVARGWSIDLLRAALDLTGQAFGRLMRAETIAPLTHARISALFDRLWDAAPPEADDDQARAASAARRSATAHGWVPPLMWDDIDADHRPATIGGSVVFDEARVDAAIEGERHDLAPSELRAAVRALYARRWSDALIADHLGVDETAVVAARDEMRLPPLPHGQIVPMRRAG